MVELYKVTSTLYKRNNSAFYKAVQKFAVTTKIITKKLRQTYFNKPSIETFNTFFMSISLFANRNEIPAYLTEVQNNKA